MVAGTADTWLDPEVNYYQPFEALSVDNKTAVWLENADHMFSMSCSPAWEATMFNVCFDPVWDMNRTHDLTDHFVAAFLLAEFYGDADAAAALAPDAVQFPGIDYKTTSF